MRLGGTAVRGYTTAGRLAVQVAPLLFAIVATVSVVAGALPVAVSWSSGLLLDGVNNAHPWPALGLFAGVTAATLLLPSITDLLESELRRKMSFAAQAKLFTSINAIPGLAPFEDATTLDRLQVSERASTSGPYTVLRGTIATARGAITLSGLVIVLSTVDSRLAGLVAVAALPVLIAELSMSSTRAASAMKFTPADRRRMIYGALQTDARAAKEIRLYGLGDHLLGRMLTEISHLNREERRLERRDASFQLLLSAIAAAASAAAIILATFDATKGTTTPGKVVVVVTSFAIAQTLLGSTSREIGRMHQAALTLAVYTDFISSAAAQPLKTPLRRAPPLRHGICFKDVWFRYSNDGPWVLKGVNLEIPLGQAMAVVGENGAGKSTLAKLLCCLYLPTKGVIEWDGVPLDALDPASLRARLSAVFQDYMAYDVTAAENIALGDLTHQGDSTRIEDAAKAVGIHGALSAMPRGYATPLTRFVDMGEDAGAGTTLSGGQWQRIAIARAVFRAARDLLILDEPSSGLDPESERKVHDLFLRRRVGRASVLISHRLSAVRDAGIIVVLRDGVVAETGTHEDLLRSPDSTYGRLFRLQASGYEA